MERMASPAYNDTPEGVLNRIREVRKSKGFTLEQLESLSGLSWQSIQRYETGVRPVTLEKLAVIAAALDVPVASLVQDSEELTKEERDLIAALRAHPSDRRVVQSTLRGLQDARKEFENES